MADFADLKSPYSVGHSRAVAALAAEAARRCGLPAADAIDLARAGLLHDIGQVAVPARIWLKAGALNDGDWEQVRLHYYGERVLARPAALARLECDRRAAPRAVRRLGLHGAARRRAHPAGKDPRCCRGLSEQDRGAAASRRALGAGCGGCAPARGARGQARCGRGRRRAGRRRPHRGGAPGDWSRA